MIKLFQKLWCRALALPPGLQIIVLMIASVGGRYGWICAHRPAHRHEIAAAFGSAGIFTGAPQPDRSGRRFTFVETSDKGFGVFLTDTASGKKTLVHEELGTGGAGDDFDLHAWPWAPDDSAFIYSQAGQIVVCEPETGKPFAELTMEKPPSAVAWLTSGAFVCLDKTAGLSQFEKRPDGTWGRKGAPNALDNVLARTNTAGAGAASSPFAGAFSLTALSSNTIAWGQRTGLWSMNLGSKVPSLLLDMKEDAPSNMTLASFSYSGETGQFLVSCVQGRAGGSIWRLAPDEAGSRFTRIATPAPVRNAVWLKTMKDGWIGIEDVYFIAQKSPESPPARLLSANITDYSLSSSGQRLLFRGIVGTEPGAGIWSYDLASAELKCVAPCADYPSPYAQRLYGDTGIARVASGDGLRYDIYLPVSHADHPHRKYPLVIGDTYFGNVINGAHGRLWIPALAACDAYVVVVNRRNWSDGIERWGEDVMAVYQKLAAQGEIDKSRVFLFGVSAETRYMSDYVAKYPGLWKGAIFLNPVGIPDFSKSPPGQLRPKILLSAGERENPENRFKKLQADGLQYGVLVDYVIGPGQGHHFVGNAAQVERTKAMVHFIFDE